jgi:putative endopeptidase
MKHLLIAFAASTALAGCATVAPMAPAPVATAEPSAGEVLNAVADAATAPKPQIGAFGFDKGGMDETVRPGDNFYQFANGSWAKNTAIPGDKSNYGNFTVLDDLSRERTRTLIDEQSKDPSSRIGATYASFLDTAAIESKGLTPFQPWLGQIKGLRSKAGLPALYAQAMQIGVATPFAAYVGQDDKLPDQYVLSMSQSGLGMPDRDYYLSTDAKLADTRAKYLTHLTNVMTLAGEPNAAARANAVLALETAIAKASWTRIESRDATKTYNKMTLANLASSSRGFDFAGLVRASGAKGVSNVLVAQPSAISKIAALVGAAPLGVLKDQLLVRSLDAYAPYLPAAFDREQFSFYGTTLGGTPQQEERWKRGVAFTTGVLGDDVSQLYVKRYFPPETKAAADKLVKNIIAAMDRRIDTLEWMAPQTKTRAHAKLAAFTPKIGYPDRWRDMSGLQIDRGDLIGNAMRSNRFDYQYNIQKLGQPIYKWEWGMTPMTVNAYANFGMVEIVFPAAILQPPFFDPNADPAVNYGGIGAVIGHELSHHFDDQGAKYDREGRLTDWWTPADVKAFSGRLDALGKQYDQYEPLPGMHVQGKLTMGENVADLAGLTVAHDAYLFSLNGQTPPVVAGTTGDQRFYLGWAQVWRRNYREANLRQRLLTDPHSPSEQRGNIVRNMDPWYPAFDVKPGEKLYLAPADRVRIW